MPSLAFWRLLVRHSPSPTSATIDVLAAIDVLEGAHLDVLEGAHLEVPSDPLPRLRRLCLSYPETNERLSHGEPTWFVRDKRVFVTYADHHHDDRVGFWCAAPPGAQAAVVASGDPHFFRPPYVGHRGWLGVYLDVPIDWELVEDVVDEAYRAVAPPSLLKQLDGS